MLSPTPSKGKAHRFGITNAGLDGQLTSAETTIKIAHIEGHKGLQNECVQNWAYKTGEEEMTIAVMVFRVGYISALAAALLIAAAGLLSPGRHATGFRSSRYNGSDHFVHHHHKRHGR